jgi:predicted nucleic acid-binding protein
LSYLVESDIFHEASHRWLSRAIIGGESLVAPVLLLAEIAGALARQTGRPELSQRTIERLLSVPNLRLVSIDDKLGIAAARVAADQRLRGADATYMAVAATLGVPLVSWDREQLSRAGSVQAMEPY